MIGLERIAQRAEQAIERLESVVNRAIGAVILLNVVGLMGAAWLGGHFR